PLPHPILPRSPPSATPSNPPRTSSFSSAPNFAARPSSASSTSASHFPEQNSRSSATTPTRAAQPTWDSCPTSFPATRPSPRSPPVHASTSNTAYPPSPVSTSYRSSTP